jgi:hypothetical protein
MSPEPTPGRFRTRFFGLEMANERAPWSWDISPVTFCNYRYWYITYTFCWDIYISVCMYVCVNINTNINRSIDGSIYLCILYYIIISYLTIYLPILSYLLFSCLVLSYLILSFFLYIYLIVSYLNLSYYPTIYLSTYLSTYLLITGTALPSRCLRFFSRIVHHVTIFWVWPPNGSQRQAASGTAESQAADSWRCQSVAVTLGSTASWLGH